MNKNLTKSYANTFIYSNFSKDETGFNVEQRLIAFVSKKTETRINKADPSFKPVLDAIKTRQTTAVLYRILVMNDVVLCIDNKELPASYKVFYANDLASDKKSKKVFIDCTGLITFKNGFFNCKDIDKLCAYLTNALILKIYYEEPLRLLNNSSIIKSSLYCYIKLFTGVLDYLRVINFAENRIKISYIIGVYYLYNMMGKDIKSARLSSANINSIAPKDAIAYDYYYDESDLENIDVFVKFLVETFKLKGLTTDIFLDRWFGMYGKGTMYGSELFPSLLCMIASAYSGAYINSQKRIENTCGRDMVTLVTTIFNIGADIYDKGFNYTMIEK